MSIAVTNSVSTIILDDGGSQIAVSKELVRVGNQGNNVTIQWSPTEYRTFPYTDFTTPTGASAAAVKDAIEAFLDSGISVTVTMGGQFAEDSAATSGETGLSVLAVRNDTIGTALTSADGDYSWLAVDSAGRLGTRDNKTEDAAHTSGDIGSFILGVRNDANAALSGTDLDYTPVSVDSTGRLKVILAANSGVDIGDVDVLSVIPGTGATNLGKAEDAAYSLGDVGTLMLAVRNSTITSTFTSLDRNYSPIAVDDSGKVGIRSHYAEDTVHTTGHIGNFILAVRNDSNSALTSTDGDYSPISVDSTGRLKVILAANSGVDIGDVDVLSVIPGTGATNLGKAEDAAHASGDVGVFALAVRNDTITTALTSLDGDYSPIAVDSTGLVGTRDNKAEDSGHVTGDIGSFILGVVNDTDAAFTVTNLDYIPFSVDVTGRIKTAYTWAEDAAHTTGDRGAFVMGVRNDANATVTSADGDFSQISVDSTGRLKVILAANSGVDIGDVDVLSIIPGTGATNLGKAEDAAHTTGDVGVFALAVRNDTNTVLSDTNGDYTPICVDSSGRVGTRDNKVEDNAHVTGDVGSFILGVRNDAFAALSGTDGDYTPIGVDSAGRVGLSAGELFLGATGGRTIIANGSFTRPADTTTYAANDVICNSTTSPVIITFTPARLTSGATGRSGVIQSATLVDSANETLKLDGDLFLFDTTVTMDNDNAAFTPTDAELATCVGVITFSGGTARSGTAGTGGNCSYPNALSAGIPFVCLTENQLYGIFVARNAYIPISAEVFTFRLGILQD